MVRAIVIPEDTHVKVDVDIPAEYVGKRLEVNIFLAEDINSNGPKKTMADFLGILSDKSAKLLHDHVKETRNEWERDI